MTATEENAQLSKRIREVSASMRELGKEMFTHSHSEIRRHGMEMLGAANIAEIWAREIEKPVGFANHPAVPPLNN